MENIFQPSKNISATLCELSAQVSDVCPGTRTTVEMEERPLRLASHIQKVIFSQQYDYAI